MGTEVGVSEHEPSKLLDKVIGWCFGILLASVLLNLAMGLIQPVLHTIIVVLGVVAFIGVVVGGIVVYRRVRERW